MRKWVLPLVGYVQDENGNWTIDRNGFPSIIEDSDVEKHHARLTLYLALRMGREKFQLFWNTMSDRGDSDKVYDQAVENIRRDKSLQRMMNSDDKDV